MASDKPGPGLEPQPVALLAVGAGGSGGGGGAMGEPRGAAGSGSGSGPVVLPAGMINPSVPIRNIRMKFAVLIGLIQVGEVSNRDIVETVLNLVRTPGRPRPASLCPSASCRPARAQPRPRHLPPVTRAVPNSTRHFRRVVGHYGGVRRPSGPLGALPPNLLIVPAVALRG